MKMQRNFVTFYSPGTMFAETTTKPIDTWNVEEAVRMSRDIVERHGATPYAFRFETHSRGDADLDSQVSAKSPTYYLGGKVETIEEVAARNDPSDQILLSNMRINEWNRIITSTSGYRWSQPLRDTDVVLSI